METAIIDSQRSAKMNFHMPGRVSGCGNLTAVQFQLRAHHLARHFYDKGILLGTPNREPQEYSRYIIGIYLPGSLYSIIFLPYSWGSLFGFPSRVPLYEWHEPVCQRET